MKKKILLSILVILGFFTLIGCEQTSESNQNQNNNSSVSDINNNSDKLTLDGYDLTLIDEGSFSKLKYKIPDNTVISSLGTYTLLVYNKKESNKLLFKVGITKFDNKDINEAMNSDLAHEIGTKSYNNITWVVYRVEDKYNSYAYEYDGDTYNINFIYDDDLARFEEEFMKNVSFEQ